MDKPEEILKQLNKQSAELQPNVLSLLEEIQQRFFTPEGELKAEAINAKPDSPNSSDVWPEYGEQDASGSGGLPNDGGLSGLDSGGNANAGPTVPGSFPAGTNQNSGSRKPVRQPNFLGSNGSGGEGNRRQSVAAGLSEQTLAANQELNDIFMAQGDEFDPAYIQKVIEENTIADSDTAVMDTVEEYVTVDQLDEEYAATIPMATLVESPVEEQQIASSEAPTLPNTKVRNPHFSKSKNPAATEPVQHGGMEFSEPKELERPLAVYQSSWLRGLTPDRQIGLVTTEILKKAPPVAPSTIQLISAPGSVAPTHEVATRIAWELSVRQDEPVLLVDADFETREISRQLDNVYLSGLAETLNQGLDWEPFVGETGIDGLYWLPSGKSDITRRKATSARWSVVSNELKQKFRYVCIYSGNSKNIVAQTWGRFCDFTFLIASMQDELGEATRTAVDDLRKNDCRLAGLITID